MKRGTVQIGELRIRATGLTPEDARRLGETVAQRLAASPLVSHAQRRIPELTVRTRSNGTNSVDRMAEQIVAGIRHRLG
jgi:hypothetical protein